MEMNFDPMTGEPITPDNTPVVQEPKKSKIGIIVGAIIAAVVVIAIAAVLIRSAIIGKGGKVAIALTNTFAETPDIVKTANLDSTAKLLESGKYTVAVTVDEAGKSGVTVEGKVVSTPKEKQISGEVSAKGFTTNGVLGITKEQLKLYAPLSPEGPEGYGKAGSFEGFCSGGGIVRLGQLMGYSYPTTKDICDAAKAGDENAQRIITESATRLGQGLSILIDLFNPQRIVIGSIFARAEDLFRPKMEEVLQKECLSYNLRVCSIVPARLGEAIGDIAAISVGVIGWEESQHV